MVSYTAHKNETKSEIGENDQDAFHHGSTNSNTGNVYVTSVVNHSAGLMPRDPPAYLNTLTFDKPYFSAAED